MDTKEGIEAFRKERTLSIAAGEGIKWGVGTLCAGIGAVFYAEHKYPYWKQQFRNKSVMSMMPLMAGIFAFALNYELTISSALRYPERWGLEEEMVSKRKVTYMPIHHRLCNFLYDHPFVIIASTGAPWAGYVLNKQMQIKHMDLQKRLMQTRVIAQGGIITVALITMSFRGWMESRGRFPEIEK
jgi:hypothetical protein